MCCGKKRQQLDQIYNSLRHSSYNEKKERKEINLNSNILFEYVGKTGMTVYGSSTGKRYRFNSNGMVVEVDARDKNSIAAVPNLRMVPNR